MYSRRFKIFSLIMAAIMLTVSVGITAKVHYCSMESMQKPIGAVQKDCCKMHEVKSCCELMNDKSRSDNLVKDKGCCNDEVKSFSFTTEFVNKIVSMQLIQFVTLLSYAFIHHFADATQQHSFEAQNIFPPPKISGTAFLFFKQVLNL
jgi:hypothetical protein